MKSKTITRKNFLKTSSLSLLGFGAINTIGANCGYKRSEFPANSENDNLVRTISYNIFNGAIGYKGINSHELPEGENSSLVRKARELGQIAKRIMLELQLYSPNIINFSESCDEAVVAEMAKMLNMNYVHFNGGKDSKGHFPGSILTSYDIVSYENRPFVDKAKNNPKELFTRHWGKAKLRLPTGDIISVHSAHLWPFKKEENDTKIRLNEINELLKSINEDLNSDSKSALLQGDLNHEPGTVEYDELNKDILTDIFKSVGQGNGHTHSSINPNKRIDFIYAAGDIVKSAKQCVTLFEGHFRMNNDDARGFALSDHLPVLADFEI